MTGVYPIMENTFLMRFRFANDLRAHHQQHRLLAGQQATSKGSRHGIVYTRALQTPFADPLGGPARILNINEMVYIQTLGILLML